MNPTINLIEQESNRLFLCFCTFVMNLKGKKISIQNVLVHVLEEDKLKKILKEILSLDNDQEVFRVFLDYDPNIAKSKYITRFLKTRSKNAKSKSSKSV